MGFFDHHYLLLFVALITLGEVALLPAIYLSFTGSLNPAIVIALSVSGSLVTDIVWYGIGSRLPVERIMALPLIERRRDEFSRLAEPFARHRYSVLFASKFIYGTRTVVQIICGMHRMPIVPFAAVNCAGALGYVFSLYAIAFLVGETMLGGGLGALQGSFIVFVAIVIGIHIWVRHAARTNWFR